MDVGALLRELYGRIPPFAEAAVADLSAEDLAAPPAPGANTIAWLVWHLTRVQDHHIAELLEADQVWVAGAWAAQCGLNADPEDTGYGHDARAVLAVRPTGPKILLSYLDAVSARTYGMLQDLRPSDLDRVVDERWDPPVTLGVRLVSVAEDSLQHAGQAGYARGLLGR